MKVDANAVPPICFFDSLSGFAGASNLYINMWCSIYFLGSMNMKHQNICYKAIDFLSESYDTTNGVMLVSMEKLTEERQVNLLARFNWNFH